MSSDTLLQDTDRSLEPLDWVASEKSPGEQELFRIQGRFSPLGILITLLVWIILAEVGAMSVVYLIQDRPYTIQVIVDTSVMIVIIFPLLYFLSFKPLLQHLRYHDQSESILQARLSLMQHANTLSLDELLQFSLDQVEALTGSSIGFFHFLDEDQATLWLRAWSSNTREHMCQAEAKDGHYHLEQAGVWAEAARLRRPVIHNQYAALPNRQGLPPGHAGVVRELVVPILRGGQVVAILGVGNKAQDYTAQDVELASTFADFAWDIIQHKRAADQLLQSEEKFRTMVDWTYDWELWLDPQGGIIYTSPACERLTGYTQEELVADPELQIRMVHPDDQPSLVEHRQNNHDASIGPLRIEYRILTRDGRERWIEHVCRPLFGSGGRYLGRRASNRDITERKLAEKKIIEQARSQVILTQAIRNIQTDVARDLHDTLGQNISFLRMNLEYLSEAQWKDPAVAQAQIKNMARVANESYELIRAMLAVLQLDDSTDPIFLFTRYGEQIMQRSKLEINITRQGEPQPLSPHQIRQLFYIFREGLNNIEKHAHATQVSGEFIWGETGLAFQLCDDGKGFDPQAQPGPDHYGLAFMRERAERLQGSLSIQSSPGKGTSITVRVPYEAGPDEDNPSPTPVLQAAGSASSSH